jgi:transposase-like protein
MPPEHTVEAPAAGIAHIYKPKRRFQNRYLLLADYRQLDLIKIIADGDLAALAFLARARWPNLPEGHQQCPYCQQRDAHYFSARRRIFKCRNRDCGKQFTVFSGTRLHSMKIKPTKFLSIAIHFLEAKNSLSARGLSGLHKMSHSPVHVLLLKFREAIRETMLAEPKLTGPVQADAAYFLKYVRPENVGTGASAAIKKVRREAGITGTEKLPNKISPKIHALVVFVQVERGQPRRYKIAKVKTETQVDILALATSFCEKSSIIITDQHKAYNLLHGAFVRLKVNHSQEFVTPEGVHTNHAEGFFSRMRHAQAGSWHQISLQYLEDYGWEMCWRQEMVGISNDRQLQDLLQRLLSIGPSVRFDNYWGKKPRGEKPDPDEVGKVVEIEKSKVKKKLGRPRKSSTKSASLAGEALVAELPPLQ